MAAFATCFLVAGAGAASQEGGVSISGAPDVILGEVEAGAPLNGAWFWRIPLRRGDALTIDMSNGGLSAADRPARFCLLAPNVRDATLRRSECAWVRTLKRDEKFRLEFVATATGRWTFGVVSSTCATFQACATGSGSQPFVYEFTARVRHFTSMTLDGPSTVNAQARFTVRGVVKGARGGRVLLHTAPTGGRWKSLGAVAVKANGSFARSTRAASEPGRYRIRGIFQGDESHRPSEAIHSYRVAGG